MKNNQCERVDGSFIERDFSQFFSFLFDELLNYLLILPKTSVSEAFNKCNTFSQFQKYVKRNLQTTHSHLFGKYSTPNDIARFMVERAVEQKSISANSTVLDLCAGTGVFTSNFCEMLFEYFKKNDSNRPPINLKYNIVKKNLRTVDTDPLATYILRIRVLLWFLKSNPNSNQLQKFVRMLTNKCEIGNSFTLKSLLTEKFDIIISNPPYLSEKSNKHYFDQMIPEKNSIFYKPRLDYYLHFLGFAFEHIKPSGILCFITPNYFLHTKSAIFIRKYIKTYSNRMEFYDFENQSLFHKAPGFHSCIFTITMGSIKDFTKKELIYHNIPSNRTDIISYSNVFLQEHDYMIKFRPEPDFKNLKFYKRTLGDISIVRQGVIAGPDRIRKKHKKLRSNSDISINNGVFIVSKDFLNQIELTEKERECILPFFYVRDLHQSKYLNFDPLPVKNYIIYMNNIAFQESLYPNLIRHLKPFKSIMEQRRETKIGKRHWFELHWPRQKELFTHARILIIRRTIKPRFIYTEKPFVTDLSCNILQPKYKIDLRALHEYLESSEVAKWINYYAKNKGNMLQIDKSLIESIPIPDEF
ncbi:MAG: N-6 DNA methylase [Candidatus Lokiarchaeota archaeon]|nr:N-6 DNA methylase [Candidatus Lokiarchaeota archaeon]